MRVRKPSMVWRSAGNMKPSACLYLVILLIDYTGIAYSVPHDFCLEQFHDGDCGKPPAHVFHYYQPGSRCEIGEWRGCPTRNKFPDEFLCSHYCIGRLMGRDESDEEGYNGIANEIDSVPVTKEEWVDEIKDLQIEDIQVLDTILDDVIKETNHTLQKLVLKKPTEAPDENATVAVESTESPTEEETEAVPESTPETPEPALEAASEPAAETASEPSAEPASELAPEPSPDPATAVPTTPEDDGVLTEDGSGGGGGIGSAEEVLVP